MCRPPITGFKAKVSDASILHMTILKHLEIANLPNHGHQNLHHQILAAPVGRSLQLAGNHLKGVGLQARGEGGSREGPKFGEVLASGCQLLARGCRMFRSASWSAFGERRTPTRQTRARCWLNICPSVIWILWTSREMS